MFIRLGLAVEVVLDHIPLLEELAIIAGLGALITVLLGQLRLPTVAGLLATGALAGPYGFGLVDELHAIKALAEVGVVLLPFAIGLEFSLKRLSHIFRRVALGGLVQVGSHASQQVTEQHYLAPGTVERVRARRVFEVIQGGKNG